MQNILFIGLAGGAGFLIGAMLGAALMALHQAGKAAKASARLEAEKAVMAAEIAALGARLDSEKAALGEHFKSLAQDALHRNSENFMTLAAERLKAAQADGAHQLDRKGLEIEKMVKPVEQHLMRLAALSEGMHSTDKTMREELLALRHETSKLSSVLRNPAAQGKWGEFVLETILEKANMQRGVHYHTQMQVEGGRRPDVIINLHDGFRIAIDSKAPINEFVARLDDDLSAEDIRAISATMARAVRGHVKSLGARAYQDSVDGSDFVILFLPSEAVFSSTLRADPDLVDYAADHNVVIASPTLIISLLRVVGLSWRQVEMAKNAAEISALGADLHKRLSKFMEHFSKIGKGVNTALASYNDAVGSFDRSVMPAARRFKKMHSNNQNAELPVLAVIETQARQIVSSIENAEDDLDFDAPTTDKSAHG